MQEWLVLFILFNFAHIAIDDKILGDCFYNDQSEDLFFTTSDMGTQLNVPCKDKCNCNATNTDYFTVNCPLCCCQKRLPCREINHGRLKWFILLGSFYWLYKNLDLYLAILESFDLLKVNLYQNHMTTLWRFRYKR